MEHRLKQWTVVAPEHAVSVFEFGLPHGTRVGHADRRAYFDKRVPTITMWRCSLGENPSCTGM